MNTSWVFLDVSSEQRKAFYIFWGDTETLNYIQAKTLQRSGNEDEFTNWTVRRTLALGFMLP